MDVKSEILKCRIWLAMALVSLLCSCDKQDIPGKDDPVPEGMVEIRPTLATSYMSIPRSAASSMPSRAYDPNATTNEKLGKTIPLPEGSTVWLIAKNEADNSLEKNSYVAYNSAGADAVSYLVPCQVDPEGNMISMEGKPLYLKENQSYLFYAVSPARELDPDEFAQGNVAFQVKNGEYFFANDSRYAKTTPEVVAVSNDNNSEAVQEILLKPMMHQTAQLKFKILHGHGVHDLGIQPSGIEISGLQDDSPAVGSTNGDPNGLFWHMSLAADDEPIELRHSDKDVSYGFYDYVIDEDGNINIEVPILPFYSTSEPVIVIFRLKINGVPTSFEMMLNEKDFKAGYSYGYRGEVSIKAGVEVITWQYVAWDYIADFPNF